MIYAERELFASGGHLLFQLRNKVLGFTERMFRGSERRLGFTKRKSYHSKGISKSTEHCSRLSDDLLSIDDEEARSSGRLLSRLGRGETTAGEVKDANGSGEGE